MQITLMNIVFIRFLLFIKFFFLANLKKKIFHIVVENLQE